MLAGTTGAPLIAYSVLAAIVWVVFVGVSVSSELRRNKYPRATQVGSYDGSAPDSPREDAVIKEERDHAAGR